MVRSVGGSVLVGLCCPVCALARFCSNRSGGLPGLFSCLTWWCGRTIADASGGSFLASEVRSVFHAFLVSRVVTSGTKHIYVNLQRFTC